MVLTPLQILSFFPSTGCLGLALDLVSERSYCQNLEGAQGRLLFVIISFFVGTFFLIRHERLGRFSQSQNCFVL